MRGLKQYYTDEFCDPFKSHLLQMRGLKLYPMDRFVDGEVASFTDAWIETRDTLTGETLNIVASFTDAWIETPIRSIVPKRAVVASFTDAWIETFLGRSSGLYVRSHLLQMRGLKPKYVL